MDSSHLDPTRSYLLKPAAAAGIVAAGVAMWRPDAQVNIPGMGNYPLPLVAAGATFVASEVTALINHYLLPHVPIISAFEAPAATAMNVGTVAAVAALVENTVSPGLLQDVGLAEITAFSLAAEVGSTYLVDEWVMPMWNRWGSGY